MIDEREVQEQQEAIRKWAVKKLNKTLGSRRFIRTIRKIEFLQSIIEGEGVVITSLNYLNYKKEK